MALTERFRLLLLALTIVSCSHPSPPSNPNTEALFDIIQKTTVESSIIYKDTPTAHLALDVYTPAENLGEEPWIRRPKEPRPTLIYFHGGGWASGDRISRSLYVLPYLQKGWAVVNADYRLLGQTNLPGCIEDCLAAIDWTFRHADQYKFDTTRVVVSGESAGGHLALMTGMLMPKLKPTPNVKPHHIAAIINWYGVADLHTAVAYWKAPEYLNLVNQDFEGNTDLLYQNTSPVNQISQQTPPILSVHGDEDRNHPFSQSEELHQALTQAGIPNELVAIKGKKHGNFSASELAAAFDDIWKFLEARFPTD